MQQDLLEVHMTLLNYGLSRGYAFQRWKTVANTILFKDPGVIKIHRTRVIHLYEADYNLAMGLKWRKALHQAEILKSLHNGQFGSRPHRNAIDPVFIEEMQFELSRLTRKTFAQTNYDATACYDRIIPSLAVLASRSFGVPKESTAVNAKTLEGASYHIRTELGVTPEGYSHSVEAPIFGTGQGSGNSPAIWCFLSSLLYQCYDTGAHPARYCYPDHTNHLNIGMIGFVDDSNGQTNTFLENVGMISTSGIHASVQKNAQHWANLLSASGGALELSKCSVHVAQWGFTLHGAPVLCTDKADFDNITVVDPVTRQERHLKYLSPYSAHKTLGHHKEPAGTQRKQLSELRTKSDNVTSFLTTCSLTREEGWTYYYACYLPGISYPLANSHFTERELATVQRKAMTRIIPKCGYNRNMKKEILFGPLKYGGANFRHLYDQQGLGQITLFLSHWRQNTETGKLLKTAVAWAQYATGMGTPIFDHTTRHIPHLESKWIASLRVYLGKSQVSLTFEPLGIPQLERAHDGYLMEWIIQSNWFTEKEIVSLNYCRLFLNVVTLSDMTNAIGDAIDPGKLEGNPSLKSSTSTWMSINQAKPSSQAWKLWKNANLIWSKSTGQLHQPLGHWISTLTNRRIRHFAYKYRSTLYIRMHQTRYMKCRQIKRDTYTETDLCIDIQSIPERAKPAEVELLPDSIWHVLATSAVTVTPNNPQHDIGTFERFLSNLDAWEYDLLRHTTLFADPFAVNVAHEDYFAAGSDGSVKHGTNGSFGWMLSTREGVRTASGMGPSRGLRMDSYRAECSGLLSLLRFLVRVGEYTQRAEPWSGIVVTDSESMLKTLFGEDNVRERRPLEVHDLRALDVMIAEWDLLNEIQMSLRQLPEVVLQYVKGHQDRNRTYASLPLFAQLNVDADDKAGEYQQEFGRPHPFVLLSPHAGVNIHFPEGTLTANVVSEIRRRTTGLPLKKYIQQRNKWHDSTMEAINWAAHAKALESQINQRVHLTKLVHECLPTFSRNNRFKLGAARKCPGCQQADETRDHILRCPNDKYRNWRALFYEGIKKFHETADTSPLLRNLWNEAMEVWFATEIEDIQVSPVLFPNELRRVIIQQNAIGWRQVFNGRFSNEWAQVQNEYTARRTTANSTCKSVGLNGLQWQQKFILEIWKSWRKVWTLRNEMVHGKDLAAQKVAQRQAITAELHAIYQHRNHIEPHVQTLLLPDVQEHLQRPPGATRNWLNTNVPVLRESLRRAKRNAVKGVRSIKSYFAPLR
jgi:ribonuclease HI